MQHGFANNMIETKQWDVSFAPGAALSVTNKSPCSWNYLHQAKQAGDPRKALLSSVEKYAWTPVEPGDELRWAKPYLQTAQNFFQDLLSKYPRG
jgi:hypothetical protein